MLKAVLFDVGSTLINPRPGIDGVFFEVATRLGHALMLEEVSRHLPEVDRFYEEEYLRNGDFWCSAAGSVEVYLDMYRYLAHLTGLASDADDIASQVHDAYLKPQYWGIIEDVIPCLDELKAAHLRLGVVSNWSPNLENLLRGLEMGPYFDEVISSADVGYRKPDPVIFDLMLERMGIEAHEAVHVGDRPDADGVGAATAGVMPIIIDRGSSYPDCAFTKIASFDELPGLIGGLVGELRPV